SEIAANSMLQMHHVVAFFQFGEINIESGTRGQGVRRLQPAWTLHFVSAEDFGIGNHNQFRIIEQKAPAEIADGDARKRVERQLVFLPDFTEPLLLAVVIAENIDVVALSQPAMELIEKLTALRFGNQRFWCLLGERTESFKAVDVNS